jgi:EmrB/QacA subfamily drug resistance transporter
MTEPMAGPLAEPVTGVVATGGHRTAALPATGGRRRQWLGMVVISLGVSLIVVDATIVGVLLPGIVTELGLRATDAEWITSVYSLTFAALLITCGRLADLAGRRRLFVLGTLVFVIASLAAAGSGSGPELIASRLLQGVGASMIMPATLSTVNAVFTGRDRALAFGIWGSLIAGMAAAGPLLGGWLATSHGWRWAFAVNLPIGAVIVVGALCCVPETRADGAQGGAPERAPSGGERHGIDWVGAALSAVGLGAIVFALIEGQRYGWWAAVRPFTAGPIRLTDVSPVPVAALGGVVAVCAFVLVERARSRAGRPVMLDLTLFRVPAFRIGSAAGALISVGELGLLFVLPLFLQNVHGSSPLSISAAIVPLALGALCAGPFAGRLAGAYGAARVVQFGMVLEVAAVLAIALTTRATTTGWGFAPWMLVYGIGLGLTSAQLTNVTLGGVPAADSGLAAGTQSTARQLGAAVGIALIGAVFTTTLGSAMLARTHDPAQARELRDSAGTYARTLRDAPRLGSPTTARAADESLAVATSRAALTTTGILALGLLMTLRLGRTAGRSAVAVRENLPS